MRKIAFRNCIIRLKPGVIALLLIVAAQLLTGCNYSRMRDDEAVQAYNQPFPKMPKQTIPIDRSQIPIFLDPVPRAL